MAAENNDGKLYAVPVSSSVGCRSQSAVALCGNDPVTISRDGIYIWNAATDRPNESAAKRLSAPVDAVIPKHGSTDGSVIYLRDRDELLFGFSESDEIIAYSVPAKRFAFWGETASYGFLNTEALLYKSGTSSLRIIDSAVNYDRSDVNDTLITSRYLSRALDFGLPGQKKRLKEVCMTYSPDGEQISLTTETEAGGSASTALAATASSAPVTSSRRLNPGRFGTLKFGFTVTNAGAGTRIYSARLKSIQI